MATLMAPSGLAPNAPSSRQDVISALLDGYAESFGHDETSPYTYSSVPPIKELPPPPPSKDEKPLPPVLTMRFQLRVDEPQSPQSGNGSPTDSPTRIVSKSMSRSSKPPSLKLLASNGATAYTPPKPPSLHSQLSSPSTTSLPPRSQDERPLPSLPPLPPEKSERRRLSDMGNQTSKETKGESRKEEEKKKKVERKPLPGMKKFVSLAELGKGPRAVKTAAAPAPAPAPTPAHRPAPPPPNTVSRVLPPQQEANVNLAEATEDPFKTPTVPANDSSLRKGSLGKALMQTQAEAPGPTPNPPSAPAPALQDASLPAKKTIGLPSNPRSRDQEPPLSMHIRGKSSTNFNFMKAAPKLVSNTSTETTVHTITPGPSPEAQTEAQGASQAGAVQAQFLGPASPVSPVSPEERPGRRPFSFESFPRPPSTRPEQQQQEQKQEIQPQIQPQVSPLPPPPPPPSRQDPAVFPAPSNPSIQQTRSPSPASAPEPAPAPTPIPASVPATAPAPAPAPEPPVSLPSNPKFPPRTTSRPGAGPPASTQQQFPPRSTSRPATSPHPISFPAGAASPTANDGHPGRGRASLPAEFPTRSAAPAIEPKHANCYVQHRSMMFSKNVKCPVACMVCKLHATGPYHACSWCYLRVCERCCSELRCVPGRDVKVLLERTWAVTREQSGPSVVVWEPEGEADGFS